jgi:hypothetical protein
MNLPLELWHYIFNYLNLRDQLYYVRGVCRNWRDFVLYKRELELTELLEQNINYKLLLLFDRETLKNLTISRLDIEAKLVSKILRYYIKLEELNLIDVSSCWSSFNNITRIKKLKKLNITSTSNIYGYQLFLIANECKKIEELILCYKYIVTDKLLDMIFVSFYNLKLLDIRNCPNYDKKYIEIKMEEFPNIKVLY